MALAEHLVGRAEELGSFDRLLADLDEGAPIALELIGEPGIGKTRLLAELGARADALGHTVLSGCATELERDLPFWVFVDALDEYVRALDPRHLEAFDLDVRAELATVLPSLTALADVGRVAIQHERYRSHRAVCALLEGLALARPVVLVLDDVHWADPASVELLSALLHRPPAAPILIAIAARPRQVPERLSAALGRTGRTAALMRIELAALTPAEAGELLGVDAEGVEGIALYEESGGNPFYLEQLARAETRSSELAADRRKVSLGEAQVPRSVAVALHEELRLLSPEARSALEGAAVVGEPFEPEFAAAAAGISEATWIEALSELSRLDLVRSTDVPRRFRFRHPLVRRAVYESTPAGWRIAAHERSADALAASGASAIARAHHVELSARPGDLAAVAVLREAANAAAHRAPASADRWLGAALRLLPEAAGPAERVELLLARSQALAATGRFADSHATLVETLRIAPPEARTLRLQLTATCAAVEHQSGRHRQAHARLTKALADLPDRHGPEAVALMIDLAVDSLYGMRYDEMQTWAARAVEASAPLADRAVRAATLAIRAMGAALAGMGTEAQSHREEAAEFIDDLPDEELARRLDALANLATADFYLDHFEVSATHAERALMIGRATGQGNLFPLIVSMLGGTLWMRGRMVDSGEVLDGALEAARLLDNVQGITWQLFNRSFAALAAGDIELALSTAEESFESLAATGREPGHRPRGDRARRVALRDEPAGTGSRSDARIGRRRRAATDRRRLQSPLPRTIDPLPTRRGTASRGRTCSHGRAGMRGRCPTGDGGRHGGVCGSRSRSRRRAAGTRGGARVGRDNGPRERRRSFRRRDGPMLAGRALAEAGDDELAATELAQAAEDFDSFGSVRYRNQAERELRRLGHTIHRRSRPGKANGAGVETLSGRELEIARLVVQRKTNPEIAAELFLSSKTVETHLRNAFRKVNVTTRVELARAVERADRPAV